MTEMIWPIDAPGIFGGSAATYNGISVLRRGKAGPHDWVVRISDTIVADFNSEDDAVAFAGRLAEFLGHCDYPAESEGPPRCPGCGRVMSNREAAEQAACNDCVGPLGASFAWEKIPGELHRCRCRRCQVVWVTVPSRSKCCIVCRGPLELLEVLPA